MGPQVGQDKVSYSLTLPRIYLNMLDVGCHKKLRPGRRLACNWGPSLYWASTSPDRTSSIVNIVSRDLIQIILQFNSSCHWQTGRLFVFLAITVTCSDIMKISKLLLAAVTCRLQAVLVLVILQALQALWDHRLTASPSASNNREVQVSGL